MATVAEAVDLDTRLLALARGPSALVPASDLARLWSLDSNEALDLAADLESGGWLSSWTDGDAPFVILSSRAAARLGIELEPPDGQNLHAAVWVAVGSARNPERVKRSHEVLETDAFKSFDGEVHAKWGLDGLPDPRAHRPGDRPPRGVLKPWHILGVTPQWNGPAVASGPCAGCGGLPLADGSVCVICLRSAYDEAIGVVRPLPLDKPAGERKKAPRTKRETGLAGGMGEPAEGHDYVKPVTRRVKRNKGRRAPRARRAG